MGGGGTVCDIHTYIRNIILYIKQFHRYTEYVSDGDCKIKKHLDDAEIYPGITIEKVECANHLGIYFIKKY